MKSILDPTFRYTPSGSTDVRKTFARVRRELRKQAQSNGHLSGDTLTNIAPMFPRQRRA